MPDREEILRSLYGAFRLARLDRSGMEYFNLTFEGFWRSFFAAVLAAPLYALLIARELIAVAERVDLGVLIVIESGAYVLTWAAFPLVAILLTRLLGLAQNYVALIVAVNWAAVLQLTVLFAAVQIGLLVAGPFGSLLVDLVRVALIAYAWYVVRTALQTSGTIAIGLVIIDVLLSMLIHLGASSLL